MQFNYGFGTDIGRRRKKNQDSGAVCPEIGLYIVADGMGGHKGGEIASALSVDCVSNFVRSAVEKGNLTPSEILTQAIQTANEAIYDQSIQTPELRGMGTTTTALLFTQEKLTIGHVGDSRCYYFNNDLLWQLTKDHSLVEEKIHAGLITREEAKTDQFKNVITRSVGFEENVNVEIFELNVKPKDIFLVCSDGLTGMLEDPEITEIVNEELLKNEDIEKTVNTLIDESNNSGGEDNITAIMVQILD